MKPHPQRTFAKFEEIGDLREGKALEHPHLDEGPVFGREPGDECLEVEAGIDRSGRFIGEGLERSFLYQSFLPLDLAEMVVQGVSGDGQQPAYERS